MNKLETVIVKTIIDEYPETSDLGEYTDDLGPGVIVRGPNEFYEHLPADMERNVNGTFLCKGEPDVPRPGLNCRGFKPYAGGEEPGTNDYYKYGMQDFNRMEGLNNGDWVYVGIMAEAEVSYSQNGHTRHEYLTSGSIWGVESDAYDHMETLKTEELADLKSHLKQFNVDLSNWEELTQDLEIDHI